MQPLLAAAFEDIGCTVLRLRTGDAVFFDLPAALAEKEYSPDLVIQVETLGNRSVLTGLDQLQCPAIFWAVDPHLNAHWQAAYGRLFDLVCSTQRAWIPKLKECGAQDVRWLPWYGRVEEEKNERSHDLAFVGRVSSQRPARKWMVEFLREKGRGFDLAVKDNLPFFKMLDLYKDSRIIPNESIFGEVNFRLFEATSCGCLVLGQDLGPEQEELFEPGREMDTYSHALELDEKLAFYLGNRRLTQAMGRAARARVLADHLPANRAATLLEYGADAVVRRAEGEAADVWTALTVAAMWEAGLLPVSARDVLARLADLKPTAATMTAVLRTQVVSDMRKPLGANLQAILGGNQFAGSGDLNLAASAAALRLGEFDAARAFWLREVRRAGLKPARQPENPVELLTLWARELARSGRIIRAGFSFDPAINLPASAGECLMTVLESQPEHLPTLKLLDTMLRPIIGMEQLRVGFLSVVTLHERRDWRLALEIGLADLKSFRLDSGLEELALALETARTQGQERVFLKALDARDRSGLLRKRLAG